jgi:hypothetical protein
VDGAREKRPKAESTKSNAEMLKLKGAKAEILKY